MSEYMDVLVAYIIGTVAGIWLFHTATKEFIVKSTLDSLIEQGYLRSFVDPEGITQLVKYYEMTEDELDRNLNRVREIIEEIERQENDEDDTP